MIIIPIKWLLNWEYTLFSDKPIYTTYFGFYLLVLHQRLGVLFLVLLYMTLW